MHANLNHDDYHDDDDDAARRSTGSTNNDQSTTRRPASPADQHKGRAQDKGDARSVPSQHSTIDRSCCAITANTRLHPNHQRSVNGPVSGLYGTDFFRVPIPPDTMTQMQQSRTTRPIHLYAGSEPIARELNLHGQSSLSFDSNPRTCLPRKGARLPPVTVGSRLNRRTRRRLCAIRMRQSGYRRQR